jgi:hypothetical protein
VLCSPIAFEDLKWPHLPDGKVQNKNLELYTAEMGKVASEKAVLFVDLFHHSQEMMKLVGIDGSPLRNLEGQKRDRFGFDYPDKLKDGTIAFFPLTINGVHITEDWQPGIAIHSTVRCWLTKNAPQPEVAKFEAIRNAVLAKNHIWHNVYRATDGYSVFGGRSGLQFVDGQTNFDVMQRELEILEVMTANRDAVIWAAADREKTIEAG